jgi:hypothetical protein
LWTKARTVGVCVAYAAAGAGCATGYHARGFSGGYSDTRLGENVFQVWFNGNGFTNRERAEDFALLHSAEIAQAAGFPYFVIVDSRSLTNTYTGTSPTTTSGSATRVGNTTTLSATTTGGDSYSVSKPSERNTVLAFREKPAGFLLRGDVRDRGAPVEVQACGNRDSAPSRRRTVRPRPTSTATR